MLARLGFPSVGEHRRFVTAIGVDAVGSGVFMPVSMLYFLAVTPLTLIEVGLAISIASFVALPAGPIIGALVDRLGAKRILLLGNALQAIGFLAYLVAESFAAVLTWTIVVTLGRTAFWGSYGNIVAAISRPGERERWFGFLGALRNVGFAVGGLASGVAITIGTDFAFGAVVAINAVSYLFAFWLLIAVPEAGPDRHEALPGTWATVIRDRPYRLLVVAQVGYSLPMMILNFALPVYAVTVLDLPGWITGVVFTVNCIMVGLGQGLVVNALDRPGPVSGAAADPGGLRDVVRRLPRRQRTVRRGGERGDRARRHGLHRRRAHRRPGPGCALGGGRTRAPARALPLPDPARLERQQHDRAGAVRLVARCRERAAVAGHARCRCGRHPGRGPARHRPAAGRRPGHQQGGGDGRRLASSSRAQPLGAPPVHGCLGAHVERGGGEAEPLLAAGGVEHERLGEHVRRLGQLAALLA